MKTGWKVLALMIMAVFTISIVPLALAQGREGNGSQQEKGMGEQFKEKKQEIKQQMQELRENRMGWLKEKGDQLREMYEFKKQELEGLKEKAATCKANNNTECKSKKLELKKGVQQHLVNTENLIQNSYERMIEKINESTGLSEEQKQTLLQEVADLEAKLNEQKVKLDAMSENSTNQEFKDAIKELKSTWQDTKKMEHRLMASLINSRMDNIAEKHQEFQTTLDGKIAQLKNKGVDTTELENIAAKFKQQTEQLNTDRKAAEAAWVAAADKDNLDAAKKATEKVKQDLEQTRDTLRQFLDKFRELNREANHPVSEDNSTNTTEASV